MKLVKISLFVCIVTACSSGSSDDNSLTEELSNDSYLIQESFFNSSSLISFEKVTSTLEDGSSATCFQLTFSSNPLENVGPFCPTTINDVAGLGFYDGATNPGLRVWSESLLNDIEADGYDMVDDEGNVHVDCFNSQTDSSLSYCLEASADDDIQVVFTIPAVPKLANSNNVIEEVEIVGVSLDGVPTNGAPPSAINGPVQFTSTGSQINFPSIDPCGGHHDPAGYYHWHLVPQVANQVLENNGIIDVTCTNVVQTNTVELFGFAKDGYPIYAYATEPDDLDECGGRTAVTDEFPEGTYHYVASTTTAPNIPACLKGVSALNSFQYN